MDQQKALDKGTKFDAGKPSVDLIDRGALVELAKVLDFGAKKYSAHNWRSGIKWSRIVASLLRHTLAFNDGEDNDPETGLSHIAHAMCNCMFLLNYIKEHPELDDRYKKQTPVPPGLLVPCVDPQHPTQAELNAAITKRTHDANYSR